jgi:hypothetical protein
VELTVNDEFGTRMVHVEIRDYKGRFNIWTASDTARKTPPAFGESSKQSQKDVRLRKLLIRLVDLVICS